MGVIRIVKYDNGIVNMSHNGIAAFAIAVKYQDSQLWIHYK